jgi:hypothetical protein
MDGRPVERRVAGDVAFFSLLLIDREVLVERTDDCSQYEMNKLLDRRRAMLKATGECI